jgi:SAM-dependent methyltransferase
MEWHLEPASEIRIRRKKVDVERQGVFDVDSAQNYNKARQEVISELLSKTQKPLNLTSALDVGCGVGYFAKFLDDLGFHVVAVDGREENVAEGKRRYPQIAFVTRNAEDPGLPEIGTFDFVLCIGLLYHLENPFLAIRNLHSLTNKILVVEAMCAPGTRPILQLVDEGRAENQGLNYVAFYPTEACLTQMLYRAGFANVYGFEKLPSHELFHASLWRRKERTMLVASKHALGAPGLKLLPVTMGSWETLSTSRERVRKRWDRLISFLIRR